MVIQLSPETEARVRHMLERGGNDGPEAVDKALRALEERHTMTRLRKLLSVADEQAAQDRVKELTPDFLDRLKREAAENVGLGKPFRNEVIP